ncbi:hypothetical protein [Pseudonocardia sp. HH130630-07]|uniref:hypothetical protein n=1 Tax=Pseudonocardia sp. HH130630-07 TaxID=1690815 RepID=UPI0012E99775|nr:hypothetical protein [Pseudonocardia sp. HH130630-07]
MVPDVDGALRALGLDPTDPAHAADVATVHAIWRRQLTRPPSEQETSTARRGLRLLPPVEDAAG